MTKFKQFMRLVNTKNLTNHIKSSENRYYLNKKNLTKHKNITGDNSISKKKKNLSEITLSDEELNNKLEIMLNGYLIKEDNKELNRLLDFMDKPTLDEICEWNISQK